MPLTMRSVKLETIRKWERRILIVQMTPKKFPSRLYHVFMVLKTLGCQSGTRMSHLHGFMVPSCWKKLKVSILERVPKSKASIDGLLKKATEHLTKSGECRNIFIPQESLCACSEMQLGLMHFYGQHRSESRRVKNIKNSFSGPQYNIK